MRGHPIFGRRLRLVLYGAATLSLAAAFVPGGCALSGTGGDLVEVDLSFVGAGPSDAPLGTGRTLYDPAWSIELTAARLVVGATYVFPRPDVATRWRLPVRGLAYADFADNLFSLNALAEWREPIVVDALSNEPVVVGPFLGEAGEVGSVTVWIDAPRGELAGSEGPTHGYHGWVEGIARDGEREVRFEGGLALEETPLSQRVDNIAVGDGARLDAGGRIAIEVRADEWLRQVDFDSLLADGAMEPDADGVSRPTAPHPFQSAWRVGFHDPDAFTAGIRGGREP